MPDTYTLEDAAMKVISDRRSIREFTPEPVSNDDLDKILEAGRQAPSGENAQPWRFIVVKDETTRKQLATISGGGSSRRFTAEFVTKQMQQRFASLQDEEKKRAAFAKLTSGQVSEFVGDAPVILVVVGKKDVWDTPYDTSAAIENMLLMITALGLGACWVIAPCIDIRDELKVKEILGIPEGFKAISLISIGHPTRPHRPRPRLPMTQLVYSETWDTPYYQVAASEENA